MTCCSIGWYIPKRASSQAYQPLGERKESTLLGEITPYENSLSS